MDEARRAAVAAQLDEELLGWPEEGGLRVSRLFGKLAELTVRVEDLEERVATLSTGVSS
jgi:hypothetical protein